MHYLDTPPNKQQLLDILEMLKLSPRELMRQHEPPYYRESQSKGAEELATATDAKGIPPQSGAA